MGSGVIFFSNLLSALGVGFVMSRINFGIVSFSKWNFNELYCILKATDIYYTKLCKTYVIVSSVIEVSHEMRWKVMNR